MADPADETPEGEESEAPKKNWRRELESDRDEARAERDQLKRELAFTKAGLDGLTDKQVKALAATHEGEMTAESLKATAEELGFTKPAETPEVEEQVEDHSAEVAQIAKLGNSPATHTPRETPPDLANLNSVEEIRLALSGQVDESWGPELAG